ncbi:MAG: hypothetical protein KDC84_09570 [Crocinitomicaceae bacterium]|nr:hypothetical protein [Crocinitomicaceae bacterium]
MNGFLIISLFSGLHAFYISFTELEYNANSKKMEASVKLTAHDLDEEMETIYGKKFQLEEQSDSTTYYLEKYLISKTSLSQNGKDLDLHIDGYEYDLSGDLFLFFHYDKFNSKKGFVFENKILFQTFPKQQNIINIKIGEELIQKTLVSGNSKVVKN